MTFVFAASMLLSITSLIFCCLKPKLIIEVYGGHYQEQKEYDDERTAFLVSNAFRILRFWNHESMNDLDAVLQKIIQVVEELKRE